MTEPSAAHASDTILLSGSPGVVGADCQRCGGRAESAVVTRAGATLSVRPGTLLEARCVACGHVDVYLPASLRVWG